MLACLLGEWVGVGSDVPTGLLAQRFGFLVIIADRYAGETDAPNGGLGMHVLGHWGGRTRALFIRDSTTECVEHEGDKNRLRLMSVGRDRLWVEYRINGTRLQITAGGDVVFPAPGGIEQRVKAAGMYSVQYERRQS